MLYLLLNCHQSILLAYIVIIIRLIYLDNLVMQLRKGINQDKPIQYYVIEKNSVCLYTTTNTTTPSCLDVNTS